MTNMLPWLAATSLSGIIGFLLAFALGRKRVGELTNTLDSRTQECEGLKSRLKPVLEIELEAARFKATFEAEKTTILKEIAELRANAESLKKQYGIGRHRFQELQIEVRGLEEDLENVEFGLYKPHFTYSDSESYKTAIETVREKQKKTIRDARAAVCDTKWSVGGSARDGERMTAQYQKLILRAFNAESEAAIANVNWNNFRVMKTRIEKALDALNKLGTVMNISITPYYRDIRLEELELVFEAAEKKQQEREEQRRLRAEQREEERVQRELLREREDAEKDELKYQKDLDKLKESMEAAREAERGAMLDRIKALEADLAAAHDRKERAIAQAQLTKVGHVYIISNMGAFGEGVLKIGLTRRLDPVERIQELGDASVPFPFDIHAMIYSENAPDLEAKLHNRFWDRRLNWANNRKEFFRIKIDEAKDALEQLGLRIEILSVPEAREYRETMVAVEQAQRVAAVVDNSQIASRFPKDPFAASN